MEKAATLQNESPCKSKLPLLKRSHFDPFSPQRLKEIAHLLVSIKTLHEAYKAHSDLYLELFEAIHSGVCFNDKKTRSLFGWKI
ncbi:MAG: hypothetical protein HWD61_10070 [Parachlamydiaceae bacterium]|nr:MAG: hypothetical protein HWD61_10070 [Parachlamydiaceae bacterium]